MGIGVGTAAGRGAAIGVGMGAVMGIGVATAIAAGTIMGPLSWVARCLASD